MIEKFRILLIVLLCSLFVAGCQDQSYNEKKSLIRAVQGFYDAIMEADMATLYDYFPQSFTTQFAKEQFLKSVAGQPDEFVLNAFSLVRIKRYSIDTVRKKEPGVYDVTVYIYPITSQQKMVDIMTWEKLDGGWVNVTYRDLVAGLLDNVHQKQKDILDQVFELRQCKNEMQELILALFDFITAYDMGLADFMGIAPEQWISVLQKEEKLVDGIPQCPAGGEYSVLYDRVEKKLIFSCSKHSSIAIPFEFSDMAAPQSIPQPAQKTESTAP